ncbi:MAG: Rap1a/Tai family immunity protein [Pseudomonadota bacterium]
MKHWRFTVAALLGLIGLGAAAAEPDNFRVRTTEDLVSLCGAEPGSETYVAAIHFCHGFAVGAYRYYEAIAAASLEDRYVCPPEQPPSRSAVIAEFIGWARQHTEHLAAPAVDSMFRFLGERFPCQS